MTKKAGRFRKLRKWVVTALKNWGTSILIWGALAAGFYYWFSFTAAQSIVLGVLFGSIFLGLWAVGTKADTSADFIPYRVSIRIHNPRDLLFKCKLVETEDDLEQLWNRVDDTSMLRRGLNFTVLALSKRGLPHLIWWDDHKTFQAGGLSFEDFIQGIEFPWRSGFPRAWTPRLYFGYRHGMGSGYNLAVCVQDRWWEEKNIENVATEKDYSTGSVYITVGVLPYGEIGLDYEARRQDRKAELEKLGWAIKDFHEPDAPGMDSIEAQNEYFSVQQHFLEPD